MHTYVLDNLERTAKQKLSEGPLMSIHPQLVLDLILEIRVQHRALQLAVRDGNSKITTMEAVAFARREVME